MCFRFPDPRGNLISTLEVGDEVEIEAGAGKSVTHEQTVIAGWADALRDDLL